MTKAFRLTEKWRAEFRAESFNAFNFVNLGYPGADMNAATYDRIVDAADGRVFQLVTILRR